MSTDFDELSRAIAGTSTRRGALRILAGGALGGLAALFGLREAEAAPDCYEAGHHCGNDKSCCSGNCCNHVCCAAGQTCGANGQCQGAAPCAGVICGGNCINCATGLINTQNCQCVQCVAPCPAGQTACANSCCPAGQVCSNNACCSPITTCPSGQCGTISNGCGGTLACECPAGQTCQNGICVATSQCSSAADCGVNTACTSHTCVSGVCGVVNAASGTGCGANSVCDGAGNCVTQCPAGQSFCDGLCVDTSSNVLHCGACDLVCSLPNANAVCLGGTCAVGSCFNGFVNCDGQTATGCEVSNNGHSNTAGTSEFLGSFSADREGGFPICSSEGCSFVTSKSDKTGRFFSITALEDSDCCSPVILKFELEVPPNVDYDLYVSGSCEASPGFSSHNGIGANEVITVWCNDDCFGGNNSFTANVEVRWFAGASCLPWTLNVYRGDC